MIRRRSVLAPLLAALALAACHRALPSPIPYRAVGDESRALREAFNGDVDKVRVVMLVSPS